MGDTDRRIYWTCIRARENTSTSGLRRFAAGKRIFPDEGVLVCILRNEGGDPGLVSPRMVSTFFHEFGHLVHGCSRPKHWEGLARPESDFMEAPSQMLETG